MYNEQKKTLKLIVKGKGGMKYQDEDLKRAKCRSRIQIKWKNYTKKTLFGAETKGKGEALLPLFQEDSSLQ